MSDSLDNWSLREVFEGQRLKKSKNPKDIISMDVPLFIRLLEFAREDSKNDMELHEITERILQFCDAGSVATMKHYSRIVK